MHERGGVPQLDIYQWPLIWQQTRGGELGVLRVREHPLRTQVHPLIAKSTRSKLNKK